MYPSGQAIWGLAWKYTLLAKNWANTHVLCIRFLTACGISWSDFSSNHFDYENDPTMYMNEDFHQIIKFLTQMVWIFEIHIDWLIEWVAEKAHLHERAFSTVCFQCPNLRNGSPNTKLFHQNKPVIGGLVVGGQKTAHHHIYKNKTFIDLLYQLLVDLLRHLGHLLVN